MLTFASAPDYENPTDSGADNGYAVTVRVSDGTATADLALTVNVTDADEPPTIVTGGIAVTSNPTSGDTYGTGGTIAIGVTFDRAVDVTGTPEFEFSLKDSGAPENTERATLTGGAGTTVLVFSYTVQAGDSDDNGIWIGDQDRTLKLDSGDTIQGTVGGLDAVLAHATLGTQSSHKVDGQPVANIPPAITTTSPVSVAENTTAVTALTATDADMDTLTWSKNGGDDAARFGLTGAGVLTFASAPDFENPTDTGADNGYAVTVRVSDGTATADLALTVKRD